jgi:hypothetical protein
MKTFKSTLILMNSLKPGASAKTTKNECDGIIIVTSGEEGKKTKATDLH